MQAERADGKCLRHATADRDQWPTAPKPQRIFANVVARRPCPIRRCRMGVVRYSRPVPGYGSGISNDTAPTNASLRQASLAWPGTEETCPKCQGQCHVYYLHASQQPSRAPTDPASEPVKMAARPPELHPVHPPGAKGSRSSGPAPDAVFRRPGSRNGHA
jgi:hypothetical protein